MGGLGLRGERCCYVASHGVLGDDVMFVEQQHGHIVPEKPVPIGLFHSDPQLVDVVFTSILWLESSILDLPSGDVYLLTQFWADAASISKLFWVESHLQMTAKSLEC